MNGARRSMDAPLPPLLPTLALLSSTATAFARCALTDKAGGGTRVPSPARKGADEVDEEAEPPAPNAGDYLLFFCTLPMLPVLPLC